MSSLARKQRVVILGASGFIGRNLAEAFARRGSAVELIGTHFRRPAPPVSGMRAVELDLRRAEALEGLLAGADLVIHAAATTSGARDIVERPHTHVTDNAVMGSLVFRAAHEQGARHLVFFSCTVMYPSSEQPLAEEDFDPARIYPRYFGGAWTKVYLEKMAEFFAGLGRTRFSVLRHSNVYGPHDKFDLERGHVFGATVAKVLRAPRGGTIEVWGDGSEARDLLHADDLVRGVELAAARQQAPFALVNLGSGRAVSVRELVERIAAASGKQLGIRYVPNKPTLKTRVALDCRRAAALFGWKPRLELEEGIRRTLEWCATNIREPEIAAAGV
jgi:nucleoside-diphosphate-sugar epimerase